MATKLDDLVIDIDSPSGSTAEEIGKIAASLKALASVETSRIAKSFKDLRAGIDNLVNGLDTKAVSKVASLTRAMASLERAKVSKLKLDTSELDGAEKKVEDLKRDLNGKNTSGAAHGGTSTVEGGDLGGQNQFAGNYKSIDKYSSAMAAESVAGNALLDGLRKIAPVAKTVFKEMAQGAWSATKGFGNLVLKVSGVKAMANGIHSATKAVSGFVRSIGRIALYRAVRGIIKSITQDFTTGLNNLYQYSKGFSGVFMSSMDSISASMQYLKNSIAAAASPFVNALAPAVEFAVDKFVDLLNVANQVVSSLLGNDTWTRAVRVPKEYAAAADEAKDSTNKAKKAADEYKNALLGFDEITKLPEPNNSSSNGGSGSGNGKQGVDYSSMFTEEQVSTQTAGWAKMLKEAWESADLSDIGNIVGLKMKSALDNIDWEWIQDKGRHIAKSVATFINGYLGTVGLDVSVGKTVGEAIYTGLTTIDTYYSTYKFGSLGTFLSNGLNSAVKTLSAKDINFGSVVAKSINAAIADIGSFAGNVHWSEIGSFIADNANSFFKDTNFKDAGKAAHDLVTGLGDMLSTAIDNINAEEVAKSLKDFLDGLDPVDIVVSIGKVAFKFGGKIFETIANLFDQYDIVVGDTAVDVELNATKLNDKIPAKDKKVDGMTAGLTGHSKSSKFSNTVSDMTASFSDRKKASSFSSSLGMTASFTGKTDNLKATDKNLSGFKAVITSKSNSLATKDKSLTGFKAVISSIVAKTKSIATWLGIKQAATGGLYKNGRWSGIAKYASGGLPNMGQLFIAREAGPELVGKMPGGGTAVMNNNQIVASVSAGVYKAVLAAMGSGGNGGNITVNLVLDGRVVSQTVVNQLRNQANRGEFPLAGMA